jgi:hypothetical protein
VFYDQYIGILQQAVEEFGQHVVVNSCPLRRRFRRLWKVQTIGCLESRMIQVSDVILFNSQCKELRVKSKGGRVKDPCGVMADAMYSVRSNPA